MTPSTCGNPDCPYPEHRREALVQTLERRGVVTTKPGDRDECCGLPRDEDGFCTYREGHPIYVERTQ